MPTLTLPAAVAAHRPIPAWMTLLLAAACGMIAANIYYAQPLVGPISRSLGLSPGAAGLIVTCTQIGYGMGLLLVVPLGDLVENRRLVLCMIALAAAALLAAALSAHPLGFLAAALAIGLGSVAVQIIVPYAAHLAHESVRGRVVGNVTSGLMLGIMLARPTASLVTQVSSWHVIFFLSAGLMAALALLLARTLPPRRPEARHNYGALLASMGMLMLATPLLRRRASYQACLFAAFSLFWTTTPLLLAGPFHLTQAGIALFALAGVAGAIAAPIAGRAADRGLTRPVTGLALLLVGLAFAMTHLAPPGSLPALALLVAAAILLDFGVTTNLVLGQRAIFQLSAEHRGRLNGLFIASLFCGGALGSALGGWAYARGGWPLASGLGIAMPAVALLFYLTEWRR